MAPLHPESAPRSPEVWQPRRRDVVIAGASAAVTFSLAKLVPYILREEPSPLELRRRKLVADYESSGTIEDAEGLRDVYLAIERQVLAKSGDEPPNAVQNAKAFQGSMQAAFIRSLHMGGKPRHANPSLDLLCRLKESQESAYPQGMAYNEAYDSVLHVPHGKLQCRSGTRTLLLGAKAVLAGNLKEYEQLVEVYTPGHVRPGLMLSDGKIFAIEMTQRGPILAYVCSEISPPDDLRVVRADDAFAAAIGVPRSKLRSPIVDTVRMQSAPRERSRHSDTYSFGKADVPQGDQQMPALTREQMQAMLHEQELAENMLQAAEKDRVVREYVGRHLEHQRQCARRFQQVMAETLPQLERLTDAELERRYYAARRELDAMDSYGEKYDLELVGLRVQRAMGTPYAADAIDEVKNARKGIMQVLPVGKMSPHDHVRDTQMQNDPVVRLRYDLSGSMQKIWTHLREKRPQLQEKILQQLEAKYR